MTFADLSIVIPVGPDDHVWQALLDDLAVFGTTPEIILSACQEQPLDRVLPSNACWLKTNRGRAHQQNAGARQTSRGVVWFVHADTRLTAAVPGAIRHYLNQETQGLGYFRLRFAADGPGLTYLNAAAANFRSHCFALPFGDQGFIVRRSVFEQLGGFDESVRLGEDLDFVVRLRAAGRMIQELPAALITSARRYKQTGWLPATLRHLWLTWSLTRQARRRTRLA